MKNDKLRELQEFWYSRLRETGFEDLETTEYGPLKHTVPEGTNTLHTHESVSTYYTLVNDYKFPGDDLTEHYIWKLHCHGHSQRKIAEQLRITRSKVRKILGEHIPKAIKRKV